MNMLFFFSPCLRRKMGIYDRGIVCCALSKIVRPEKLQREPSKRGRSVSWADGRRIFRNQLPRKKVRSHMQKWFTTADSFIGLVLLTGTLLMHSLADVLIWHRTPDHLQYPPPPHIHGKLT